MKKLFLFVAVVISAISAIASDQFYVIMKDGSVESYPTDKVDSISFDDPQIAKIMGFNDMAREIADMSEEIAKMKKEIADLKSNQGNCGETIRNDFEYVDLGLPSGLKWATMNIGASSPEEYGDYFAWGEVKIKDSYDSDNSITFNKTPSELESASIIGKDGNLTAQYDAASQNWGGKWRMPTSAEFDELKNNCTWTWTTLGGVNGYKVASKVADNNNWIFLPAAGCRYGTSSDRVGSYGVYLSSSVYGSSSKSAYYLFFDSSNKVAASVDRESGLTVRPVTE